MESISSFDKSDKLFEETCIFHIPDFFVFGRGSYQFSSKKNKKKCVICSSILYTVDEDLGRSVFIFVEFFSVAQQFLF